MNSRYFGHKILANTGTPKPSKSWVDSINVNNFRGFRPGDKIPKGEYTANELKDILLKEFTTDYRDDNKVLLRAWADPIEAGLVSGSGYYNIDEVATVITKAKAGWRFIKWSDNNQNQSTQVAMDSDKDMVAYYEEIDPTRLVTLIGTPEEAIGTLSGGGRYVKNTLFEISAEAAPYWTFIGWADGDSENPRTVSVNKDTTFEALFSRYMCHVSMKQTDGGIIDGPEGDFISGTELTFTATPDSRYNFLGWSTGDSEPTMTYKVGEDIEIFAYFSKKPVNVYTSVSPSGGGSITGGGMYSPGTNVTLTAVPKDSGWGFKQWSDGSTENPRIITVPDEDVLYTAEFQYLWHLITTKIEPADAGTIDGGGRHKTGEEVTLTVNPTNQYCEFVRWSDGNTDNPRTFIDDGKKLTFTAIMNTTKGKVNIVPSIAGGFSSTTTDWQWPGTSMNLKVTLNDGYRFVGYPGNIRERDIDVVINTTEEVIEIPIEKAVKVDVRLCPGNGTVQGVGWYTTGEEATLTVVPDDGYAWWMWDDESTDNPRTFIVGTEDMLLDASISKLYTITTAVDQDGHGTTSGDGTYPRHLGADISAISSEGYIFDEWTWTESYAGQTFEMSSYDNPMHISLGDQTDYSVFTAHFRLPHKHTVNIVADPPEAVSEIIGQGEYFEGNDVTIEAVRNNGWNLVGWYSNGTATGSKSNPYTYSIDRWTPEVINWTAKFERLYVNVTIQAQPYEAASTVGTGRYLEGETITISATPNHGWNFYMWDDTRTSARYDNPREWVVVNYGGTPVRAICLWDPSMTMVIGEPATPETGSVSLTGDGIYETGTTQTVTAVPGIGYKFVKWLEDDSTENPRTYVVNPTEEEAYGLKIQKWTAVFAPKLYPGIQIFSVNNNGSSRPITVNATISGTNVSHTQNTRNENFYLAYSIGEGEPMKLSVTGPGTVSDYDPNVKKRYYWTKFNQINPSDSPYDVSYTHGVPKWLNIAQNTDFEGLVEANYIPQDGSDPLCAIGLEVRASEQSEDPDIEGWLYYEQLNGVHPDVNVNCYSFNGGGDMGSRSLSDTHGNFTYQSYDKAGDTVWYRVNNFELYKSDSSYYEWFNYENGKWVPTGIKNQTYEKKVEINAQHETSDYPSWYTKLVIVW